MGVYGINYGNRYYNNYAYNNNFRSLPVQRGYVYQPSVSKKEGPSAGKIFLGLALGALTVAGIIMAKKSINNSKHPEEFLKNSFSKIFGRDISIEEAQKLTEKYKQIYNIEDKNEFAQALFKQLKNDYGFGDNSKIRLVFVDALEKKTKKGDYAYATGIVRILNPLQRSKEDTACTLAHELRHAFQHRKFLRFGEDNFANFISGKIINDNVLINQEEAKEISNLFFSSAETVFGKQKIISQDDKEYSYIQKLAKTYLDDIQDVINGNPKDSHTFAESDAWEAGGAFKKFLNLFMS